MSLRNTCVTQALISAKPVLVEPTLYNQKPMYKCPKCGRTSDKPTDCPEHKIPMVEQKGGGGGGQGGGGDKG